MRLSNKEFLQKPLRVHTLLADIPLHDVWVFRLRTGQARETLCDFRALLSDGSLIKVNPVVKILFKIRTIVGQFFGWDDQPQKISTESYIHRLAAEDREKSIREPGSSTMGPFHLIYEFEREALDETINATVHAFSAMAMESADNGYTVYWAIYVKKVSFWTPVYMALIDPFRRLLVYPAIIRKVERAWVSG